MAIHVKTDHVKLQETFVAVESGWTPGLGFGEKSRGGLDSMEERWNKAEFFCPCCLFKVEK